jgi:uncharacterized membrane protein YhaH (DUF805 family)
MAASQMSPVEWAKRPLQKYAEFSGRAPRAEYWWYTLALIIVFVVANVLEDLVGVGDMVMGLYGPLTLLLALATIVPGLAVTARRLHDTNRSGWWMLIAIVPYFAMGVMAGMASASGSMGDVQSLGAVTIIAAVGGLVLLVFMVLPSKPGDNLYGPNPYGEVVW